MPAPRGPTDGSTEERTGGSDGHRSHNLIESGCLRELAAHILDRSETTPSGEINIRQTAFEPLQPTEIVCQFPGYEQLAAVIGNNDGCRLTAPQCTLTAVADVARDTWELLAFEITYPQRSAVYSVLGRRTDRYLDSVVTIIDPRPNPTAPDTAIVYDITTDRVEPIPISLDGPLLRDRSSPQRSPDIGYHVAIDWFVS